MNKMNKKGFTLIEMLVVIAIIAVLVSIVIPTVSSSTNKAKAATDAANLRSILAEATTDYLGGTNDDTGFVKVTFDASGNPTFAARDGAPVCKTDKNATLDIDFNETTKVITPKFGDHDISYFSNIAEGSTSGATEGTDSTQAPAATEQS